MLVYSGPYTGWFRSRGQYFKKWDYRSLWEKKVYIHVYVILNGLRGRGAWTCRPDKVKFVFVCLDKRWSLQNKYRYTRQIAASHSGCWCLHKDTWRSTETNHTQSSHMSCKMHWCWQWDLRTFIVNCNKVITSVPQIGHLNFQLMLK